MRILVLTFYFQPDLCAGSFRTTPFVEVLQTLVPEGSTIDVVTTLPNRYSSFSQDAAQTEQHPGLTIHRIPLPNHKSGMIDQSKVFLKFFTSALRIVEKRDYDLVFATSSRLMTAVLGAWISRRGNCPLYLDIRDIFVDTIKDVLPKRASLLLKPLFSMLEKWTIARADKVNLVSAGFSQYFTGRYPNQKFSYFTNGIDDEFLAAVKTGGALPRGLAKQEPLSVLYAGNMGEGQGLHAIIPGLAKQMEGRVNFKIIGDGGRKQTLEEELSKIGSRNVELLPPMDRCNLLKAYLDADILFLHLNDYDAFKKVLPSKIFEYAALGKPVWAGVSGYAADFIKSEVINAAVFHPCDVEGAVQCFAELTLEDVSRTGFIQKYARKNISMRLAEDFLATALGDA